MGTVKREGNKVYVQHMDKMRRVGTIVDESVNGVKIGPGMLIVMRDEIKHLMQVWQAYGFAKEVIDHEDWFDYVQIIEKKKSGEIVTYVIPRKDIILYGRQYESEGYEPQYFIGLDRLKPYQVV